jgi:hypothetical protein
MRLPLLAPRREGWTWSAEGGLALISLVLLGALFTLPVALIPLHVARNINEGWNAYFAAAAMHGEPLYPARDAAMANTYPPLSFYLVGVLGRILGDDIVAGRLVSLAALLWGAVNVYRLSRWLGAARLLATLAASWYLLAVYILLPDYIAMDDPQFLAFALVTAGAVLFLQAREPRRKRQVLAAAVLIVAGGLVKQNEIALPLALCTWAAMHQRRNLALLLLYGAVCGAAAAALLYARWGPALIDNVLLQARRTSWERAVSMTQEELHLIAPYALAALLGGLLLRGGGRATLVLALLIWSALAGFWMLSGAGVNYNVLFDLILALALGCVALVLAAEAAQPEAARPALRRLAAEAAMMLSLFGFVVHDCAHPYAADIDRLKSAGDWSELSAQLAGADGPVLCENLAVCYWAHKPFEVDFFNFGEKLATGITTDSGFRSAIAARRYRYIELDTGCVTQPCLPRGNVAWLLAHYDAVGEVANQALLLEPAP